MMGMGDFEARQRALKQQERRRKSDCTELLRKSNFSGLSQADTLSAEIKKEVKKSQDDATKFMHENLSKGSQGLNQQFLKDKAMKEEERQRKLAADEMRKGYKGGVREDDLKLAEIKKEERLKKQAADEMRKGYKGGVREDDLKLAEIKKEERLKKQAADEINRGYKGGVKEEDLKLAEIKKEARQKEHDAANHNHSNLSKNSQDMNGQYLKDKAAKEEERQKKLAADEMRKGYKGGVREDDLKLAGIKKEERLKKQAADEINRGYKGGVKEEDLKLAEIKKEEREKRKSAVEMNSGYKGGVREDDLKLAAIKKEGREQKQAADQHNHSYGGVKGSPAPASPAPAVEAAPKAAPEAVPETAAECWSLTTETHQYLFKNQWQRWLEELHSCHSPFISSEATRQMWQHAKIGMHELNLICSGRGNNI